MRQRCRSLRRSRALLRLARVIGTVGTGVRAGATIATIALGFALAPTAIVVVESIVTVCVIIVSGGIAVIAGSTNSSTCPFVLGAVTRTHANIRLRSFGRR